MVISLTVYIILRLAFIQANIFAAHLLIDDESILSMLHDEMSDKEMAYELGVDINLVNLKISELAKYCMLHDETYYNINKPSHDFLKNYQPQEDEWTDY